jgi:hypothetical protein
MTKLTMSDAARVTGVACVTLHRSLNFSQLVESRRWGACLRGGHDEARLFACDELENGEAIGRASARFYALQSVRH